MKVSYKATPQSRPCGMQPRVRQQASVRLLAKSSSAEQRIIMSHRSLLERGGGERKVAGNQA